MASFRSKNCPHCTYLNSYDAAICFICEKPFVPSSPSNTSLSSSSSTTPNTSTTIPFISPLNIKDCSYSSDDLEIIHNYNHSYNQQNKNKKIQNKKNKSYPSNSTSASQSQSQTLYEKQKEKNQAKNSNNSTLYDPKYSHLFENFSNTNSTMDMDMDMDTNSNSNSDISSKKRRSLQPLKDSHSKPKPKRRKINRNENNNNSIPTTHRELIGKAYSKFLNAFMNGCFSRELLEIQIGPDFCRKAMKKFHVLKIGPQYDKVEIIPVVNENLPPYSMRFKHYGLNTKLVYSEYKAEEMIKLKRKTIPNLRDYFLKRLKDKTSFVYDNYICLRLDWGKFEAIQAEYKYDPYYESLGDMVRQVRNVCDDEYRNLRISILLENVEQQVVKINEKRMHDQNAFGETWCPFHDVYNLKDCLSKYELFRDPTVHFTLVSKDKVVEHMEGIVHILCDGSFKGMKIQSLTRRCGNCRYVEYKGKVKNNEVFREQLIGIDGISMIKAQAIINVYPTVQSLRKAYKRSHQPGLLLKNTVREIGEELSKNVYDKLQISLGFL